ncbi:MAG: hypothetical protein EZS28_028130 [Streblomastix strix]|uniref:Mediator of RNA polymerase II transcription subunit 6 n=1 Tax=Streblomastix strix TaxID=222440 RepID=A0A5J4V2R6_9EUKA|nr:MAG: hypothetical protein EZS28_028130 [Streblomastix strix]
MEEDEQDEQDFKHVSWRCDEFLQHSMLTRDNWLEYFSLSQFYDRNCINQKAREQQLNEVARLNLIGIEYSLEDSRRQTIPMS